MHEERYRLVPLRDRTGIAHAFALVDAGDYVELTKQRWCLNNHGYAVRRAGAKGGLIYMHRQIVGLKRGDKTEADHVNRNRLDNRRANLRRATHAENMANRWCPNWIEKSEEPELWPALAEAPCTAAWGPSIGPMRVCRLCGESLEGRRSHARFCSDSCRREAHRICAILSSPSPGRYGSLRQRTEAARNRANGATGALLRREGIGP